MHRLALPVSLRWHQGDVTILMVLFKLESRRRPLGPHKTGGGNKLRQHTSRLWFLCSVNATTEGKAEPTGLMLIMVGLTGPLLLMMCRTGPILMLVPTDPVLMMHKVPGSLELLTEYVPQLLYGNN